MTSYLVRFDQSGSFVGATAITVGAYPIRISQVNMWCRAGGGQAYYAHRYEGGTASGGSAVNVVALRQGAPAASATARVGTVTLTGTARFLGGAYVAPGSITSGTVTSFPGSTAQITFPLTTIVAPGSVFTVEGGFTNSLGCEIYFEELRLAGSY